MTETNDYSDGWACQDCLLLLCGGETPPELDEDETDAYLSRIGATTGNVLVTLGRRLESCGCDDWDTDEHRDGCERLGFSWSRCDVCGSTLGGGREAVTLHFDTKEN